MVAEAAVGKYSLMIKKYQKPIRFMVHCAAKNDFSNIPNLEMKHRMQLNTVKTWIKNEMSQKKKQKIRRYSIKEMKGLLMDA